MRALQRQQLVLTPTAVPARSEQEMLVLLEPGRVQVQVRVQVRVQVQVQH